MKKKITSAGIDRGFVQLFLILYFFKRIFSLNLICFLYAMLLLLH